MSELKDGDEIFYHEFTPGKHLILAIPRETTLFKGISTFIKPDDCRSAYFGVEFAAIRSRKACKEDNVRPTTVSTPLGPKTSAGILKKGIVRITQNPDNPAISWKSGFIETVKNKA